MEKRGTQVVFCQPQGGETEEEIAWHNMRVSDQLRNVMLFSCSALGWLRTNPNKNYQDLEVLLREKGLDTHLIADNRKQPKGISYGLTENGKMKEQKYLCIFSCRPKESALMEMAFYWASYKDNFEGLSQAGNAYQGGLPKYFSPPSDFTNPIDALQMNRLMLKIVNK